MIDKFRSHAVYYILRHFESFSTFITLNIVLKNHLSIFSTIDIHYLPIHTSQRLQR